MAFDCDPAATNRRNLLKWTGALAGATTVAMTGAQAQTRRSAVTPYTHGVGGLRKGMFSFMLAHEQFPAPELMRLGSLASLSTSDHLQPWQDNQGHAAQAWVTMGALGAQAHSWMGTTVTCPTMRYNPAVVAEAFATLSHIYPGRIFLGVGSGEALNEQVAVGSWPKWQERWDRLIEAFAIPRQAPGIVVPDEALVFNAAGLQVAVMQPDNTVRFQKVSIYRDCGTTAELRDGLQGGENLILSPPTELIDGAKVRTSDPAPEQDSANKTASR